MRLGLNVGTWLVRAVIVRTIIITIVMIVITIIAAIIITIERTRSVGFLVRIIECNKFVCSYKLY